MDALEVSPSVKSTSDVMSWEVLLESFGKISTDCTSDPVDITELLFDTSQDAKTEPIPLPVDYDIASLTLSPFADKSDKKDEPWIDINNLQATVQPDVVTSKMEIKPKAMQLALANEIEVQAPWVDVSALAASISEAPVTIKEKTPESIFTLATFVPTHMQSYIDLSTDLAPTANIMTHTSFDLDTPEILDVGDKVFNDSEIVPNIEHSKLFNDSGIVTDLETTKLFAEHEVTNLQPKLNSDIELLIGSDDDRSLNTPPPCKVQQKIEINPANSVMFNTDLDLEDTLLFDNEPPSNMYVVRTENIFGKEIAKRNALQQLAADTGICACMECNCDPSEGECRNCNHEKRAEKAKCSEDTCSCVDCKCDHQAMKCTVGCGRATDTNDNTFLHYHKRHNNSTNLEDLGIYTVHECDDEASPLPAADSLECACSAGSGAGTGGRCASKSNNGTDTKKEACCSGGTTKCCVTICFKKLEAFKQFLTDNELVQALKASTINLTTSL